MKVCCLHGCKAIGRRTNDTTPPVRVKRTAVLLGVVVLLGLVVVVVVALVADDDALAVFVYPTDINTKHTARTRINFTDILFRQ